MPDPKYGRLAVVRAMQKILNDPNASIKQRLEAARIIVLVGGYVKRGPENEDEIDKLLG